MGHKHLPGKDPDNSAVGGFIRTRDDRGAAPSVRLIRPSDLSKASGEGLAILEANKAHRSQPGASKWPLRMHQKRKGKLAVMGIPADVLDEGDPKYARCVRLAASYRKARTRELAISHGFVSNGVSSLLATAALALASSRYLYEIATKSDIEKLPGLLKSAQSLADSARQNELAAWELCAREAVAKKKGEAASAGIPWVVAYDEQKPRRGPKTKQYKADLTVQGHSAPIPALPPIGSNLDGWVSSTIEAEVSNARMEREASGSRSQVQGEDNREASGGDVQGP